MNPVEKYKQDKAASQAQAGFDLLVGIVKWAAILAFLIWWCRVPNA